MPVCRFCGEHLPTANDRVTHVTTCATKTSECPICHKHIQRALLSDHLDRNCIDSNTFEEGLDPTLEESLLNSYESQRAEEKNSGKFDSLFEKASNVQQSLHEGYYSAEVDHVKTKLQFNIIVMGAPRVGKSALINALCNGKIRAETSSSLNSCTKEVKCYVLEEDPQSMTQPFKIHFYDTPGIESWTDQNGQKTMLEFIEQVNPLCVIYCASPGSFADLKQLQPMLQFCQTKQIFCALVCTNMWSGNTRDTVIAEFERELNFFGEKIDKYSEHPLYSKPHRVTFFGHGALCTMVNSAEYFDPDFSTRRMPVQGVDELIHGIMQELDQEKLLGWCYAVLYRRTYWEKISQKIGGFFSFHFADLYNRVTQSPDGTVANFLAFFNEKFFSKKKE